MMIAEMERKKRRKKKRRKEGDEGELREASQSRGG